MRKKFLSLIIIPHTKSRSRTLTFSKRAAKIAMWSAIVAGILILVMTADYMRIRLTTQSYRALLSENNRQKETLKQYESSVGALQEKVKRFEDRIAKLNMIAGLKSPDKLENPGVGDYPRDPQMISSSQVPSSAGNIQTIQQKTDDIQKNLDTLTTFFESRDSRLASTPTINPVEGGLITSNFNWRTDPFTKQWTFHYGLDIVAAWGNPVRATADGFVLKINDDKLLGKSIILSHGLGVTTLYGHLSKITVREGQKVKRGDVIGNVGNTGKAIGPHVHYEVRSNDKRVNPHFYLLEE